MDSSLEESFRVVKKGSLKKQIIDSDTESEDRDSSGVIDDSFARRSPKQLEDSADESEDNVISGTDSEYEVSVLSPIKPAGSNLKNSNNSSLEIHENRGESSLIEISSDEDKSESLSRQNIVQNSSDQAAQEVSVKVEPVLKQSSIANFVSKIQDKMGLQVKPETQNTQHENNLNPIKPKLQVSQETYDRQKYSVQIAEQKLMQVKNTLRIVKLDSLPDKGKALKENTEILQKRLNEAKALLESMSVKEIPPDHNGIHWDDIEAGFGAVAPRTFGKKGIEAFNSEKQMTVERLDQLHSSLKNCPGENDLEEDPKGLKVELMRHQKRGLKWLLWREKQKPSGGILADDMGLGKTLTMIALTVKTRDIEDEEEPDQKENRHNKYSGGTLIVCPASLLNQWAGEVERRTKRGLLSVELYHGPKREVKAKRLAQHDLVITTYAIVSNELQKSGAVFRVNWRRVILDEAHQIRNHKTQSSEAVCQLSAKSRWALTGTPVHNKELDMYALLKFLRCSPFDDLRVWKHWVSDKSTGGQERLHAIISSLMLRRTKDELMGIGQLSSLPGKKWELITVNLDPEEIGVYQKILIFSKTLFAQFLHQRAEKNQESRDLQYGFNSMDPNSEYFKMRNKLLRANNVKEIKQHDILVLLLRLRQICCHPSLITKMLEGNEDLGDADDGEESEELNLLDQLNKLNLADDPQDSGPGEIGGEAASLQEASKGFLNPSHPVFNERRRSSKIRELIKTLKEKVPADEKAIIVSQWSSLLKLVAMQLEDENIHFDTLDGSIPVQKRMPIVDNFNNPNHKVRVLLLSLTAGGVGLNLVGGNHLFLLDLHWNPQLENQAQDRIYRMGQTRNVFIYKFMAGETIEERIKSLQENKLALAEAMLTGSKQVISNKLSLQDLKMLFDFK